MDDLVERFYEPLYRFAYSLAGAEHHAEDLTQETFYLWAEKGSQLRDASKAKSWLFTTLYREFLGSRRRATRHPIQPLDETVEQIPASASDAARELDATSIMSALLRVEETYRVPLTLFYLQELSYREIAALIDAPIGTVMSRLSRGKEQLRRLVADGAAANETKIISLPPRAASA